MLYISFKYCNPSVNIIFNSWNDVYLQGEMPVKVVPYRDRGALVYRLPANCISYKKLKQGMLIKPTILQIELLPMHHKIK